MLNYTTLPQTVQKSAWQLRKGDVIKTMGNNIYAFMKFPKGGKSWYGKSMKDGRDYRIRLMGFEIKFDVVGTFDFPEVEKVETKPVQNDLMNLKPGDLFVIKHGRGDNAELFRFVRPTGRRIVALNPITNKTYNIDTNFTFTKIDNLPY
jgi:hypothetical protein